MWKAMPSGFLITIFSPTCFYALLSMAVFSVASMPIASLAHSDAPPGQSTADKHSVMFPIKQRFIEWMLTDQKFVDKALQAGRAEVELSQLALQKSSNAKIKTFAQRMVDDHGKASLELKEIAQDRGLKVPLEMDTEHAKALKSMQSLEGAAFDARYVERMTEDHDESVSLFVAAGADEKLDAQLQTFAQKTLPVLRDHLAHAKALAAVETGSPE